MNDYAPGTRVIAVRDGNETTIFFYGEGTYVGDEIPPEVDIPPLVLEEYEKAIKEDDESTEEDLRQWSDSMWEQAGRLNLLPEGYSKDDAFKKFMEKRAEEKLLPMDERVRTAIAENNGNPKIVLDNDKGVVWGYQCWWGPKETFEKKFPDAKWEEVPLP